MSTGSIEEKIIQRQLSKEGLADIVDDKEQVRNISRIFNILWFSLILFYDLFLLCVQINCSQVNQFSSDDLRDLFTLQTHTASDTHDTLRCRRCSSVRIKEATKKTAALTAPQSAACARFLEEFIVYLQDEAYLYLAKTDNAATDRTALPLPARASEVSLPFTDELAALQEGLQNSSYASLPVFSKAIRDVMQSIEGVLVQARQYKKVSVG